MLYVAEMSELVIAVDGGGYKTDILLADAAGNIVMEGTAESTNPNRVGYDVSVGRLRMAVSDILERAGLDMQKVDLVVTGSLLVKRQVYRNLLTDRLEGWIGGMKIVDRPIDGALRLVRKLVRE